MAGAKLLSVTAVLALGVGLADAVPTAGQVSDSLSGVWSIEYARSTRMESDGSITVLEWADAQLVFHIEADSALVAVWTARSGSGRAVKAVYRGFGSMSGFELTLDWEASGVSPTERVRSQHLVGRLDAGELRGQMWVLGTVARSGIRTPWRGYRDSGTRDFQP